MDLLYRRSQPDQLASDSSGLKLEERAYFIVFIMLSSEPPLSVIDNFKRSCVGFCAVNELVFFQSVHFVTFPLEFIRFALHVQFVVEKLLSNCALT